MGEVSKVLFIVNKFAGGGYQPHVEGRIIRACDENDVEGIIEFTRGPGHAIELAANAAARGAGRVVAVGGDGTLNEVAQGLLNGTVPMGIIPRGSGNGLARHLGIPLTVRGSLKSFFTGRVIAADTLLVNRRLSLNVSGIGFDGHVASLFGGKTGRGFTGYARLVLSEFTRFPEFEATLDSENTTLLRKAFVIAAANSSQYGNNACIAPAASIRDGLLHLAILKKFPLYRLDFIYAFFARTLDKAPFAEIISAPRFRITTSAPVPCHIDGESRGTGTDFVFEVLPASLQMVIPARTLVC